MPSRLVAKRKQRHQSEPLPRTGNSQDDTDGNENENESENIHKAGSDADAEDASTVAQLLDVKSQKSRSPLDPHLHPAADSMDTKERRATTLTTTTFPLTPTSAIGEAERPIASSKPEQPRKHKMSNSQNSSPHPPPPSDVPASNTDSSTVNDANTHNSLGAARPPAHHPYPRPNENGSSSTASSLAPAPSAPRVTMSHRMESASIRPRHFQEHHFNDNHYYAAHTHPSPPPISAITHSPSLSSDRSSVNSPAPTILPPLAHPAQFTQHQHQPYLSSTSRYTAAHAQQGTYHPSHYYPNTVAPTEVFTPAQPYSHAYGGGYPAPPQPHVPFHHATDMSQQYSVNPYVTTGSMYGHGAHGGGGGGNYTPIYTDDAATKLSDRVRRRCFNCCTTDTSTWRRSSLNPGKVLCNKCGLFERTHSRPRPEQFPHKRAPLQIPRENMPQDGQSMTPQQSQAQSMAGGQGQMSTPVSASNSASHNLPPTTAHPSLGAAYSHPSALPQIQEWLRPNSGSSSVPNAANNTNTAGSSSSSGPSSRAHSSSSASERHHPYANAAAARSPQALSARLAKRSDSVNSDVLGTNTPPRVAQNLTPSPSPPPEGVRAGVQTKLEGSPRVVGINTDTASA